MIDFDAEIAGAQERKESLYGGLPPEIWERYVRPFHDAAKVCTEWSEHVYGVPHHIG